MKKIASAVVLSALAFSAVALASEESLSPSVPRYEIGGSVSHFDPQTSTIKINGKAYVITTDTKVWVGDSRSSATNTPLAGLSIPEGTDVYYDLSDNGKLRGILIILDELPRKETKGKP